MSTYHTAKAAYGVILTEEECEKYGIDPNDWDYTDEYLYVVVPYELGTSEEEVAKLYQKKFKKYNITEQPEFQLYVWSY